MGDHAGGLLPKHHARETRDGTDWAWLLAIFLVALLYRGLCFSIVHEHPLLVHPGVDAGFHDGWARRIVCGDWFGHGPDDVFKPPLYPYFLAAIYSVLGTPSYLVQWVQFLLGAVSCVLVAVLAGRFLGPAAGRLAGLISALYAPYLFFELQLLTPTVSIVLNLAAALLLARVSKRKRLLSDLCAGAILGLSAGVRPDVILPAALLILYLLGRELRASWRGVGGRVACIAIGFAGVVLPIAVRNYRITETIIPISSNAGINFYVGNVASPDGTTAVPVGLRWGQLVAKVPQPVLERPAAASRWWRSQAWQQMQAEPGTTLLRFGGKAAAFLNRREFRNNICYHWMQQSCWPLRMPVGQYGLVLPLAVVGLVALWRDRSAGRRDVCALCGLWVAGYWMLGTVFFATARFRLPAIPFLIIPSAWAAIQMFNMIRHRRWTGVSRYGMGFLIVGIVAWPMWFGDPKSGWVRDYVNLGNSLRVAEKFRDAANAYRQALAIQSDDPDANYLLARLLQTNAPRLALEHLSVARRVLPDSPGLMLATAEAHMALGETEQARQILTDLVRLSETSNLWPQRAAWATAHIMLADLEPSRAPAHWRQAWSVDRRTAAEASFLRGREPERVLETFRAEAREKKWDWYSQANHGMALLESGRGDEAEAAFREAIRLAPEREALKFQLARSLLRAGRRAEAAALLDELGQALPDCPLRHEVRELHRQIVTTPPL